MNGRVWEPNSYLSDFRHVATNMAKSPRKCKKGYLPHDMW